MKTGFDHAVVIVRNRLQKIAGVLRARKFTLSKLAKHNLGTFHNLSRLACLTGRSADLLATAVTIAKVTDAAVRRDGSAAEVVLLNIRLRIEADPTMAPARLCTATLLARDATSLTLDRTRKALFGT